MPSSVHNPFAGEPSPQDSWSNSWSNDLDCGTFSDESLHSAVEKNAVEGQRLSGVPHDIMASSLSWSAPVLDCQSPRDTDTPPCQQQQFHGEVDDTLADMNDLSELNSRIYHLQMQVNTGSLPPRLCNDMTGSTRSLLAVVERTVDGSRRNGCQIDHQDIPPTYSPANPPTSEMLSSNQAQGQDARFRRKTIESSVYPDEINSQFRGVADTSTLFLILAG